MPFAFGRDHQARKLGLANVPATRVGRYCETRLRFSRTLRTRVALSGENSFAWDDLCGCRRVLRLLYACCGEKRGGVTACEHVRNQHSSASCAVEKYSAAISLKHSL